MFKLALARPEEARACYALIEEGRAFQKQQGFVQWTDAYPLLDDICCDIEKNIGYALKSEEGVIAGYICVDFSGEPAYDAIKGEWRSKEPSGVLHRMAISGEFRGCGLGSIVLSECERVCLEHGIFYIRADTSPENKRMQHVFEKNGYQRCGFVEIRGNDKIAYDKLLK